MNKRAVPEVQLGNMAPWLNRLARPAGASAAGAALLLAFPPFGLWWLAPVGVALLALVLRGVSVWAGAGWGLLAGLAFFVPVLSWTNLHTGVVPWLLLSVLQSLFVAGLGAASAVVWPLVVRWRWLWVPWTSVVWVLQEAVRDRAPFGGFPWARLAFAQDGSPLLRVAVVGGAPLVTAVVALVGGLLALLLWSLWRWRVSWAALVLPLVGVGVVFGVAAVVPLSRPGGAPVVVAIVQGNVPRLGLDFNAQRRAVLDNHVAATVGLARRVTDGVEPQPDLVVWPENSSDIDPLVNADAAAAVSRAADAVGVPILVGAVLRGPGAGDVRNAGLLWRPRTGPDRGQLYVKRHPVPFAETIPLRPVARLVSAAVDRVSRTMVAGDRPGVIDAGAVSVGDVICFEVAYDEIVRDTVTGGAGVLVVQTNNATFNPAEARQQLAMVRLRAVEHGRDALMASTVGVSAFAFADGRVVGATGFNTAAVVVRHVRPGGARTLATALGWWPELVLVAFAVAGVAGAVALRWRGVTAGRRDGVQA